MVENTYTGEFSIVALIFNANSTVNHESSMSEYQISLILSLDKSMNLQESESDTRLFGWKEASYSLA